MMQIEILGRMYTIQIVSANEDPELKDQDLDGYCSADEAKIVIRKKDIKKAQNSALRHELIHAFMFECGLAFNWEHSVMMGHDETTVDWFAIMWPKIHKIFVALHCEE